MNGSEKKSIKTKICKVPVIMQLEALECGAACLDMILAYYEKWIPLEAVRMDCGISRDGSKAINILKAARRYGLIAEGFRCEIEGLFELNKFPCIIHWNFNHFVVLCGFKGNKAYLNDPARGNYAVSMEEFDESFTGVCMTFEPGPDFEPGGKPKLMLDFAKKQLIGAGAAVAFVISTGFIGSFMGIGESVFSRFYTDYILTGTNQSWFSPFVWIVAGFFLMEVIVLWVNAVVSLRIGGKMAAVGNSSYMWKILHLPMRFYSQRSAGDILIRKESNATIANSIVETIAPLLFDILMMVFYLVVMARYSPVLTAIGVVSVLINAILARVISKMRINITRVGMRDEGKFSSATVSGIEMIETIKATGAENGFFGRWAGFQASVTASRTKLVAMNARFGLLTTFISELSGILILGLGVGLTFSGKFTLGMIIAFQGFYEAFSQPALTLIEAGQIIQEMRTQMERIEDVMEYPNDVVFDCPASDEKVQQKLTGDIELSHVTFGYSPLEAPLIEDLSLHIESGQKVAIVGMSGCGKSTISKLISGLYQPWSGEVKYDGSCMNEISRDCFNGSLGVVDQDIVLFDDTIENNIKLWDRSIEDFEMILAARDAQILEDIVVREGGFKYKITEDGKDFSGGQRQRLEIARVLAQDPSILIMDEATSALDASTEYDVVKAIENRGITCLIIAHRLSTIRDCDNIIVLDHGKIAEQGTHEELMKLNGKYVDLVSSN